jgi:hypothetical protein
MTNAIAADDKVGRIENLPLDELQYDAINLRSLRSIRSKTKAGESSRS